MVRSVECALQRFEHIYAVHVRRMNGAPIRLSGIGGELSQCSPLSCAQFVGADYSRWKNVGVSDKPTLPGITASHPCCIVFVPLLR